MDKRFLRFPGFKDKALTLSYDDGVRQDKQLIKILDKNKIKATFNICGGGFTKGSTERVRGMSKQECLDLYKNSCHEVAIHGYKHLALADNNTAVAVADVIKDRLALEKVFGGIIRGMAYAHGSYDDNVVEILRLCGIAYSRTTISTEKFDIPTDWLRLPTTCHHNHPKLMELAKQFIESEKHKPSRERRPKLFYLWGHSYEFDTNNNWKVIEDFTSFIGNREDVWYATNIEIYDYVNAFDRLQYSADGKTFYNPTDIDVYFENNVLNRVLIPAGKLVSVK